DDQRVDEDGEGAHGLLDQQVETTTVEQTLDRRRRFGRGDQTDQQGADETADQVDADHVERVVVTELELQADRQGAQRTGGDADDERAQRVHRGAGRGDGDQTRDDTGGGAQRGGVTVAQLLDQEPGHHGRTGGDGGGQEGGAGEAVGAHRGTGVEAVPTEPQQTGAEHDERQVVRAEGGLRPALALAENQGKDQGGGARVDVDGGATGEVDRFELVGDPAAGLGGALVEGEHPVRDREVDDGGPDTGEEQPGSEL